MKRKLNVDKGYTRKRAAGDDGWDGRESAYGARKKLVGRWLERSGALPPAEFLELGCGAGNMTLWLAGLGYRCWGVDITPKAVEWALEKNAAAAAKADFRCGDVTELEDFADASFDVVLDGHCLHWLVDDERRDALAAARRVLRAGGILLVCSQCNDPKDIEARRDEGMTWQPGRRVYTNAAGQVTAYYGKPEGIVEEVRAAGFETVGWEVVSEPDGDELYLAARKPGTRQGRDSK